MRCFILKKLSFFNRIILYSQFKELHLVICKNFLTLFLRFRMDQRSILLPNFLTTIKFHSPGLYRMTTQLKRKYPGLKILLGVGGDVQGEPTKWLELLESSTSRISFINSVYDLIKTYDFDGLDLAYEFPKTKPKKIRSSVGEFV